MTTLADNRFLERLGKEIGKKAIAHVRFKIPSKTLRKALNIRQPSPGKVFVQIPHYWAVYVHDGRNPFGPQPPNTRLMWFRNPRRDPRLNNGKTPVRASRLHRVGSGRSKAAYILAVELNREHRKKGGSDATQPVVFVRAVKQLRTANRFFSNQRGMKGFEKKVDVIVDARFENYLKKRIPFAFKKVTSKASGVI